MTHLTSRIAAALALIAAPLPALATDVLTCQLRGMDMAAALPDEPPRYRAVVLNRLVVITRLDRPDAAANVLQCGADLGEPVVLCDGVTTNGALTVKAQLFGTPTAPTRLIASAMTTDGPPATHDVFGFEFITCTGN